MLIDWKGVSEKVVVALITAGVLGAIALLGSNGTLVRVLGGVTSKELAEEIAKHPGLAMPQGTSGASVELPKGALIAFAKANGCPNDWMLVGDGHVKGDVPYFAPDVTSQNPTSHSTDYMTISFCQRRN
jgi:hypothetical protein